MKRIGTVLSAALGALILITAVGCDSIRDYSVNSYQGVLPSSDLRPTGSVALTQTTEVPKPSTPEPTPPAAGEGATKPLDPAK